jgi:hypothetical protein
VIDFVPRIMEERHPDPLVRRSVRVIAMLSELHKAGFQRLRAMPFPSNSGGAWRLWIAPATHFYQNHGALLWSPKPGNRIEGVTPSEDDRLVARYTSGQAMAGAFFDWSDAAQDDARTLADKLIHRRPDLVLAGIGWDHAYAGWFQRVLGLAERSWFPEVFSNSHSPGRDAIHLTDLRPEAWRGRDVGERAPVLPLPPPGELALDYQGLEPGSGWENG